MKRITLSIAAIAMIATAAQADIALKSVGGSASLFYGTNDARNLDLLDKKSSYGNAAVNLHGATSVGSCATCTTLNWGITGVSTMGLEDTLVHNTWVNQSVTPGTSKNFAGGLDINDGVWIDTLNLVFHPLNGISNTTMVVGRQELDTPMVFTEKWNIAKNTFDAAVAVNNDIVDTTLVAAWVGRSNGHDLAETKTQALGVGGNFGGGVLPAGSTTGNVVVSSDGISDNAFNRFLTNEGAYAFGAVTKAIPGVTAQGWYYIAPNLANVAWLQADGSYEGFGLGAQYVYTDPDAGSTGSGFAVKLGYNYEGLGLSAAYSSMDDKLVTAGNLDGTQSKLYTEAWWNYAQVSQADTDSFNVTATYSIKGIADLGVYYTNADHKGGNTNPDMTEVTVTAGTKLGNLDATLAYVNTDIDDGSDAVNEVQAYLTYNF